MLLWTEDYGRFGNDTSKMRDGLYAQVDIATTTSFHLSTTNPRTGSHALRWGNGVNYLLNQKVRRVFGAPKQAVGFGQVYFFTALPSGEGLGLAAAWVLGQYRDAANGGQITVVLGTDGGVVAYLGGGSGQVIGLTLLGRSDPCITAGGWVHFEMFSVGSAASAGSLEVRVNGVTVLNLAGIQTYNTANHEFSQVVWMATNDGGSPFLFGGDTIDTVDMADAFAWDTNGSQNITFIGDKKAFLEMPVGDAPDSGFADWLKSSGSTFYGLISDIPPDDDTSYIYSPEAGDQVGVAVDDLPANATAINAVVGWCRARKTDAGTCTINIGILSAGVVSWGADIQVETDDQYCESVFELDPATSAPFTPSAVNAAKLVFRRVA